MCVVGLMMKKIIESRLKYCYIIHRQGGKGRKTHIRTNERTLARRLNNVTIQVYTCDEFKRASKKTTEKKSNTHQQPISMFINASHSLCIINNVHDDRVLF